MQKRLALLFIVLLFVLALVPANYQPDEETLAWRCSLPDAQHHFLPAINSFFGLEHNEGWTILPAASQIPGRLPQIIPQPPENRAPPA